MGNIIGLAVSLACVIIIARYVPQAPTVNHFIDHLDNVALVTIQHNNRPPQLGGSISPLDASSIKLSASIIPNSGEQISVNNHLYDVKMFVVDTIFLQIIPYPVLLGSDKLQAP